MSVKPKTKEEALEEAVEAFDGDKMAADTFLKKYAKQLPKDKVKNGKKFLETKPEQMWERMAEKASKVESDSGYWKEKFYNILEDFVAVPQGSVMFSLGNEYQKSSVSNCFTVPVKDDSLEAIFDCGKQMARTYSYRGGVGTDISILRPRDSVVHNSARASTGAVSFMDFYSYITNLIGQCIAEDQEVLTKQGYCEMGQVGPGDEVWTKEGYVEVGDVIDSGEKEVYEIKDNRGYTIEVSLDHKFLTVDDGELVEKKVEDFSVGEDIILIPGSREDDVEKPYVKLDNYCYEKVNYGNKSNRLNENVSLPDKLNEKLAYFLGFSYGDGYIEYNENNQPFCISLATGEEWPEIQDKLFDIIEELFDYTPSINQEQGGWNRLRIYSKIIGNWLEVNEFAKQKSGSLVFPEKVRQSPKSVKMSFLSGYFDADGYASGPKKGYVFSSINNSFLEEVQKVLMEYGIVSKQHKEDRSDKGWQDLFSLAVVGKTAQKRFVEDMEDSVKVQSVGFVSKRDSVLTPYKSKTHDLSYNKYSFMPDNSQYHSTSCAIQAKEEVDGLPELLVKSELTKIEKVGEKRTKDLKLLKEHLFMCEGFYTHNSGRRGALMLTISDSHPDLYHPEADGMDFINIKRDLDKVTGANISIRISDEFMRAVRDGLDWKLSWKRHNNEVFVGDKRIGYSEGPDICVERTYPAQDIWDNIVESATESAEPGVMFWDQIQRESPSDVYEDHKVKTTNPCSEQPLPWYGACTLLSINLTKFVENPFSDEAKIDYHKLYDYAKTSTRFLDNVKEIDIDKVPLKGQKEKARKARRIGIGTHGLGDMLCMLGVKYDSDEAVEICDNLYKNLKHYVYGTSANLAEEKGSFPDFDAEKHFCSSFMKRIRNEEPDLAERIRKNGLRNIALLTLAPTGCSRPDSLITTDNGILELSEIVDSEQEGFHQLDNNLNVQQENKSEKVTKGYNNGEAETRIVTLESGLELESTLNHRYKVLSKNGNLNWKRVDELNLGDVLVTKIGGYDKKDEPKLEQVEDTYHNNNSINLPEKMSPEFSKFLGIFYGDGSVHHKGIRLHCGYEDEGFTETVTNLVKNLFSIEPKFHDGHTCKSIYVNSTTLVEYLKNNGICKEKSTEIEIPKKVRTSSRESVEAFMEGFFIADGSNNGCADYKDTTSKKFAQQLAICSRAVGQNINILTYDDRSESKGDSTLYRVYDKKLGSNINHEEFLRYVKNENENLYREAQKHGEHLSFDRVEDIEKSSSLTLDIEVPQGNRYILNSFVSHNTVSMLSQTSSGVEPIFRFKYKRNVRTGNEMETFDVYHHLVADFLKNYSGDFINRIEPERFEGKDLREVLPEYFQTVEDIDFVKRTELQGVIQKHIDSAISNTVNIPAGIDNLQEVVSESYFKAWKNGCKGYTVYVDGSREGAPLQTSEQDPEVVSERMEFKADTKVWKISDGVPYYVIQGKDQIFIIGYENSSERLSTEVIELADSIEGHLYRESVSHKEIEKQVKRAGFDPVAKIGRLVSVALKNNCANKVMSILGDFEKLELADVLYDIFYYREIEEAEKCPECGSFDVNYQENCFTCESCGYSKCGI